jgi:hypothetical protein
VRGVQASASEAPHPPVLGDRYNVVARGSRNLRLQREVHGQVQRGGGRGMSKNEDHAGCVLNVLRKGGPKSFYQIKVALEGECFPRMHPTLWRRVDRAVQTLRKEGLIEYVGQVWRVK